MKKLSKEELEYEKERANRATREIIDMFTQKGMPAIQCIISLSSALATIGVNCGKTKKDVLDMVATCIGHIPNDDWSDYIDEVLMERAKEKSSGR